MNNLRLNKIGLFTSNRSEWGLLKPLAEEIKNQFGYINIIACSSHCSLIYKTITDINFKCEIIENLISSDTKEGNCKSAGILMMSLPETLKRLKINWIIILGDRYESIICAITAYMLNIKIMHLHGGERSGNMDDAFRDCISRMSSIHCVATQKAYNRLYYGFHYNKHIYKVGAIGCQGLNLLFGRNRRNKLLISYHSVNHDDKKEDFKEILKAIISYCKLLIKTKDEFVDIDFILANNDFGGYRINKKIKDFVELYSDGNRYNIYASSFIHLEREKFLSHLSHCSCIIGNSSTGIIEAPMLRIPTINIGNRQKHRERASSIIDVKCKSIDIKDALCYLNQRNFEADFSYVPYQGNNVVEKIMNVIKKDILNG